MADDCRSNRAETMARIRERKRTEGACWECPAKTLPGSSRCRACLERKRIGRKLGPS